ncbi:hypothetical protein RJ639_013616 [Escallonia herrerae]|uniref:Uncharacterized protein n=1 Tax=Escallonia herrerae TaxID=1293975 RepID=A0AA88VGZ0_9ASTE|nr:hypothetical protein RJ639_013616 [Escallonia herrerae]
MGGERSSSGSWGIVAPGVAPVASAVVERDDHWRSFDNSVNAVSFGFVATAILISMFLVMAIFERFLRSRSTAAGGRNRGDLEAQMMSDGKLEYPSPKNTDAAIMKGLTKHKPICLYINDYICKRGLSIDARRRNSYLHSASCSRTMSRGVHITILRSFRSILELKPLKPTLTIRGTVTDILWQLSTLTIYHL